MRMMGNYLGRVKRGGSLTIEELKMVFRGIIFFPSFLPSFFLSFFLFSFFFLGK